MMNDLSNLRLRPAYPSVLGALAALVTAGTLAACTTDVLVPVGGDPAGDDAGPSTGDPGDDGGAGGEGADGSAGPAVGPVGPNAACSADPNGDAVLMCGVSPSVRVLGADATHVVVASVDGFGGSQEAYGQLRLLRLDRATAQVDRLFQGMGATTLSQTATRAGFARGAAKVALADTVDVGGGVSDGIRVFDLPSGRETVRVAGYVDARGGLVASDDAFFYVEASGEPGLAGSNLRRLDATTGATASLGVKGRPLLASHGRLHYEPLGAAAGSVWSVAEDGSGAREELPAPAARAAFAVDAAGRRFAVEGGNDYSVVRVETSGARTTIFHCATPYFCMSGPATRLTLANGRLYAEREGGLDVIDPEAAAPNARDGAAIAYLRGVAPWFETTRLLEAAARQNPSGYVEGVLLARKLPGT